MSSGHSTSEVSHFESFPPTPASSLADISDEYVDAKTTPTPCPSPGPSRSMIINPQIKEDDIVREPLEEEGHLLGPDLTVGTTLGSSMHACSIVVHSRRLLPVARGF